MEPLKFPGVFDEKSTTMPAPLEDISKIIGSLGTMIAAGWGFLGKLWKRFTQIQDITERGGKPGVWFFITYTLFQYIYAIALIACGIVGLALLVGGVVKLVRPPGLEYLTPFFEDSAFPVLGVAILILLVARFNILSWVAMLLVIWIPARIFPLKQSAAWYNLWQFSLPLAEPKPIFMNPGGISNVADIVISELERSLATSGNFAATPTQLTIDERANAALIGCLLEKEHTVRGWRAPQWKPFYAAVAAAELNSTRLVSPSYLLSLPPNSDFYATLINEINERLPDEEPKVPDSAEARNDLSNALKILTNKYHGSAKSLAFSWWRRRPKLRLAFNRARSFPPLDVPSMIPQFLKLAVRWGSWPEADLGNFIYPYAARVALVLFEKRAMLTLPTVKTVAFKQTGQLDAYRETMRRIVARVKETLSASNKPEHRKILTDYPTEWGLAAAVDFAFWSYSSELKKKKEKFERWKIDDNGFVARKGDSETAKDNGDDESDFPKED